MPIEQHSLAALLRPELASLEAYVPHGAPTSTIRLDANESPPLPLELRRAIADSAREVALERYPDARASRLRSSVAAWTGAHPDELVLGTGSDEVIALLLSSLSRPRVGRARATCLFPTPTFVMYRVSAMALGVEPVGVALDSNWDLDLDAMRAAIDEHEPNVLFLATPNNPTGNRYADERVRALIDHCAGRTLVVLDEAYAPFAGRDERELARRHPHVARLGTLSKIGLAALRVGWVAMPSALAREVDKSRQPFNVDAIAQRMACEALERYAAELREHARAVAERRERLASRLAALTSVTVFASDANFLWLDVGRDAGPVFDALLARGVLVRSFHRAGGRLARCLRVTVSTDDHHDALVTAMRDALASLDR